LSDWDGILRVHGQAVWKTICRTVGDRADAEDCFQETFLEFMRVSLVKRVRDPLALLKHIAIRRGIDVIRARVVNRVRLVPLEEESVAVAGAAHRAVEAEEFLGRLRGVLSELDSQEAVAFVLTQLEGVGRNEAAAAMNVTVGHLAVLLHRARGNLQRRFSQSASSNRS
jgi:RNA polymerase sigma-70 factor (ECF subfamily)